MRSYVSADVVRYVENKAVDFSTVRELLAESVRENQWSNFGPLSKRMDHELAEKLELDDNLRVVSCCNATVATHALIAMQETLAGRPLRWATSSFGFYSSVDGNLAQAQVLDCDSNGMLDLNLVDANELDGIIVTNVFGQADGVKEYQDFAREHGLRLVVDAAMDVQPATHTENECISLHHTKPWGFGEGGCAIVRADHEKLFRSMISFGHDKPADPINRLAMNGKISEVSCAFILAWMQVFDDLRRRYNEQYLRIAAIGLELGFTLLAGTRKHPGIPANVPLLAPSPIQSIENAGVPLRRYYFPLGPTPVANDIYSRIVNVPCHRGIERLEDQEIADSLNRVLAGLPS